MLNRCYYRLLTDMCSLALRYDLHTVAETLTVVIRLMHVGALHRLAAVDAADMLLVLGLVGTSVALQPSSKKMLNDLTSLTTSSVPFSVLTRMTMTMTMMDDC